MGLMSRLGRIFGAKANKVVAKLEDPCEMLDMAYAKQLEMGIAVKKSLLEVTASRKQVEMSKARLIERARAAENSSKNCLKDGKEDRAKKFVERQIMFERQIAEVDQQIISMMSDEEKLITADVELTTKIELMKDKKEQLKAQYRSSKAQSDIAASFTNISDTTEIGGAVQRANDRIDEMQAKAAAITELVDKGALQNVTGVSITDDPIDESEVDKRLETLKNNMIQGAK